MEDRLEQAEEQLTAAMDRIASLERERDLALREVSQARVETDALEDDVQRLTGAIETLVLEEVISAGKARELHGMTIQQQRAFWHRALRPEQREGKG